MTFKKSYFNLKVRRKERSFFFGFFQFLISILCWVRVYPPKLQIFNLSRVQFQGDPGFPDFQVQITSATWDDAQQGDPGIDIRDTRFQRNLGFGDLWTLENWFWQIFQFQGCEVSKKLRFCQLMWFLVFCILPLCGRGTRNCHWLILRNHTNWCFPTPHGKTLSC